MESDSLKWMDNKGIMKIKFYKRGFAGGKRRNSFY